MILHRQFLCATLHGLFTQDCRSSCHRGHYSIRRKESWAVFVIVDLGGLLFVCLFLRFYIVNQFSCLSAGVVLKVVSIGSNLQGMWPFSCVNTTNPQVTRQPLWTLPGTAQGCHRAQFSRVALGSPQRVTSTSWAISLASKCRMHGLLLLWVFKPMVVDWILKSTLAR